MTTKFKVLLAVAALLAITAIYLATSVEWPASETARGTIGGVQKADRYHSEQISDQDVVLNEGIQADASVMTAMMETASTLAKTPVLERAEALGKYSPLEQAIILAKMPGLERDATLANMPTLQKADVLDKMPPLESSTLLRSEERRLGKECRIPWAANN